MPLGLAHDDAYRYAHLREHVLHQGNRRRHPAEVERGHQLDTSGTALLGGARIGNRGRDDFECERSCHRSRTYQASQPKWPV